MSRNEMFFLLACAVVATIMSTDPMSAARQSPVSIASLLTPAPEIVAWNETSPAKHEIDRP